MYKQINKIVLRKIIYSNFKIKALTNNQARNSQVCNTKMTGFGHEHLLFERQMHWKWERERERDSDYEKEARKLHSRKPHLLNRHHFPAKIPLQRL